MSEVLYRKYRPQQFDEVAGQEHVKRILSAAIAENQVAHAYLFSGPRGVGKTSVARILARALGVNGVDLIEIDAASHRGIEDVREIRESVNFHPSQSERKLYILDEVHMLTNEAFNALLKTLEEPPTFVYFVLCTTEPHKVPVTILSRCQRLNFMSPSTEEMSTFLTKVAADEGYQLAPEAALVMMEMAEGSFRDALVVLDQTMSSTSTKEITVEAMEQGIGVTPSTHINELFNLIIKRESLAVTAKLNDLMIHGADMKVVMNKIITRITERLLAPQTDQSISQHDLLELLDHLMEARRQMVYVTTPAVPFTVALMKWMAGPQVSTTSVSSPPPLAAQTRAVPQPIQEIPPTEVPPTAPPSAEHTSTSTISVSVEESISIQVEEQIQSTTPPVQPSGAPSVEGITAVIVGDSDVFTIWPQVLNEIKREKRTVEALLKDCTLVGLTENNHVLLDFKFEFHKKKVEENTNRTVIEGVLERFLGRRVTVVCQLKKTERQATADVDILIEDPNAIIVDHSAYGSSKSSKPKSSYGQGGHGGHNSGHGGPPLQVRKAPAGDKDLLAMAQEVFGGQLIE